MSMTLSEYVEETARTAGATRPMTADESQLLCMALGLAGEAGEFADLVKKMLFHERTTSIAEFTKELGDVMWYWSRALPALNTLMGTVVSHADVLEQNIGKLRTRYPEGFTPEASEARVDLDGEFVAVGAPARPFMTKAPVAHFAPSLVMERVIDQQEGPNFLLGPGHQTDPQGGHAEYCPVHIGFCPEWCEADPIRDCVA